MNLPLSYFGIPNNIPLPERRDWRIGVIGLGGISYAHIPAYQDAGMNVVAGADIDPARREEAQQKFGIPKLYADYRDLIGDPDVEIISLVTQPTLREEVVAACAAAGKPIQTEKPFALDVATCERMVAIAAAANLPLGVSQNYRWHKNAFIASGLIQGGWVGKPYLVSIEVYGTQDKDLATHPYYSTCEDFLTIQWNTHLADLVRGWMGRDPLRVSTRTSRMDGQAFRSDNLLVSLVDFGPGATGHILHSELHRGGLSENCVRIEGDAGTLKFPLWGEGSIQLRSDRVGAELVEVASGSDDYLSSFCGPMADFLINIEQGTEPTVSGRRNLATIRQVLAEDQSTRNGGQWVSL